MWRCRAERESYEKPGGGGSSQSLFYWFGTNLQWTNRQGCVVRRYPSDQRPVDVCFDRVYHLPNLLDMGDGRCLQDGGKNQRKNKPTNRQHLINLRNWLNQQLMHF